MLEVRLALPEDDEMQPEGRGNPRETTTKATNSRVSSVSDLKASLPFLMRFDQPICSAFP